MGLQTSEWYTRPKYIEAARLVLGEIDLDPASCAAANQIVKAKRYFTKEQNGLEQSWSGRVWLNPPYGRSARMQGQGKSTIKLFVDKLLAEYERNNVTQAILLATTEVNAKWFYPLWQFLVCVPDHKVNFIVPIQLHKYSQMFGTCFVYLGPNEQKFIEVFSEFGSVVKRVNQPKLRPVSLSLWEATS